MTACVHDGCGGVYHELGFCTRCGRPRPTRPDPSAEAAPTGRSTYSSTTTSTTATRPLPVTVQGTEGAHVSLPTVGLPDPASRILSNPSASVHHRRCRHGHDLGQPVDGVPAPDKGFCPMCGEPYSFLPGLDPGAVVAGQYDVLGCVAHGGLGWIYLARDLNLEGKHVALKGLINTADTAAAKLAVNESRVLTALEHDNIVRIFNVVTHPDRHTGQDARYIVMDFISGLSLREVKQRARAGDEPAGGLRLVHVIGYGREILAALEYLHEQGLLYCDMKPDNVIHGEKRIKLIDLGGIRRLDDTESPVVGTDFYRVGGEELRSSGLTVRSDLYGVGRTLRELAQGCPEWTAPEPDLAFGVGSMHRLLDTATAPFERRFGSAAEMASQLDGVLTEILCLRDGRPRPFASTEFAEPVHPLDAGLGQPPALGEWTHEPTAAETRRPAPVDIAHGLPVPQVADADPAGRFLRDVRAPDAGRLLVKLANAPEAGASVELCYRRCRAHLDLLDPAAAERCLDEAEHLLRRPDWRLCWYRGLAAAARGDLDQARDRFDEVYQALPGEVAPKLALGLCAELLDRPDDAVRCYRTVWTRDRGYVGAAFGLVRLHLRRADRAAATAVLDEVPEVSRHHDAALVAAVRVLSGGPSAADLNAAADRLGRLYLDEDSRERLTAVLRERALGRQAGVADGGLASGETFGDPPAEAALRVLLERSYRRLARQAGNAGEHGALVDLANAVRPVTLI